MADPVTNATVNATLFDQIISDPYKTLSHPGLLFVVITLLLVPYVLKKLFPNEEKVFENPLYTLEEYDIASVEKKECYWEVGVSQKSCSVVEDGILRALEFTEDFGKPTLAHIVETVKKAMVEPREDLPVQKPQYICFLDTVVLEKEEIEELKSLITDMDIQVTSRADVKQKHPEWFDIKKVMPMLDKPKLPQEAIPFNPQPPRRCFHCHKSISGKASQCSACKAVIYCSADCAKMDWPNHKVSCKSFKATVDHVKEWKLHEFPFTYYNADKILCNYNVVPFLSSVSKHNVGVFQRMCGCFQQMPWGSLGAHMLAGFQENQPSPLEMFQELGLPEEMFPLSKSFGDGFDFDTIDGWEALYTNRGWSFDNPAALVLEVPMTVWYLVKEYHLKQVKATKGERQKVTIHLVGVEKEADLLAMFEVLLPFFPHTDVAIHMIGNEIGPDIPPEQRAMMMTSTDNDSSIFITVSTTYYMPDHLSGEAFVEPPGAPPGNFGTGKPDLIICLNAGLVVHEEWAQAIAAIAQSGTKILITERMEQLCIAAEVNLPRLGTKASFKAKPNPFRQPLYDSKTDVNLPGWSNGFILGINCE